MNKKTLIFILANSCFAIAILFFYIAFDIYIKELERAERIAPFVDLGYGNPYEARFPIWTVINGLIDIGFGILFLRIWKRM